MDTSSLFLLNSNEFLEAYGPVIADVAGVANKDKAVQLGPAVIGVLVFCPQGLYAGVYE